MLTEADLPFTLDTARKFFADMASGVEVKPPTLSPSVVAFIEEFEPVVRCLPIKKFPAATCACEFGVSATNLRFLGAGLLTWEYRTRISLLSACVVYSQFLALLVLTNKL